MTSECLRTFEFMGCTLHGDEAARSFIDYSTWPLVCFGQRAAGDWHGSVFFLGDHTRVKVPSAATLEQCASALEAEVRLLKRQLEEFKCTE